LDVVVGPARHVGNALSYHPGIDHISFVGSTTTGRSILTAAAGLVIPSKVELGGKSPNVVFADADLDEAIPVIARSFTDNSGQNCYAGSRLLVDAPIGDEVRERLIAELADIRMGPWDEDPDMGPVVSEAQANSVRGYIDDALDAGARRLNPVGPDEGWYVSPALIDE